MYEFSETTSRWFGLTTSAAGWDGRSKGLEGEAVDVSDDSHLTQSACTLYGLIHARYIITAHGLDAMYNKVSSKKRGNRGG